ncbi:MAG TPA: ABC transporter substrate-binding protein, partial [Burkholderiales bacterium]|nr:ABC transporter substrate-binding protein [Burkholderiales bacterium]
VLFGIATVAPAQAAEPIYIGLVDEVTGPQAEAGILTMNGVKLAVDEVNAAGGIMGRQIELRVEDNASTNPGTVLAYSKLVDQGGVVAVIGPLRSTQVQAASPTIAKAHIPAFIGGSDPSLTRVNNPWIFRIRPNDLFSSKVMAEYAVKNLKGTKVAIIHSTDTFGSGGKNALVEALKAHGIEPVLIQGYTNNSQDFTAIVLAIKKSGADVLATYMTNSPDVGIFAKQLRQLGVNVPWIGSASLVTDTAMKLAGESLWGTYSVADFVIDANEESKVFAKKFRARHGADPDLYSGWSYGAVYLIKHAIEKAKSTEPEAMRQALLGTRGLKGVEGIYDFEPNGDAVHGYNVVKNEKGKVAFIQRIDFPAQ